MQIVMTGGLMCESTPTNVPATDTVFDETTTCWGHPSTDAVTGVSCWITKVDVYGSRIPKEMHMTVYNYALVKQWAGIYKEGVNGNLPS